MTPPDVIYLVYSPAADHRDVAPIDYYANKRSAVGERDRLNRRKGGGTDWKVLAYRPELDSVDTQLVDP